jgi:hypothetical protein
VCTGACEVRCEAEGGEGFVDVATGRCYLFFADALTWSNARARCAAQPGGVHLVTFRDEDQLAALVAAFLERFGEDDTWWTGGNDLAVEGAFRWESGEPFEVGEGGFPWNVDGGQPNAGDLGAGEDCAASVDTSGHLLHDRRCSDAYAFVCERPSAAR